MKLSYAKLVTYIEQGVEHNDKDPKLKTGDCVRIKKYDFFWPGEDFVAKEIKNTVLWTYNINDIIG